MNWLRNLFFILIIVQSSSAEKGSCRAAKKCCDGKDSDCLVENSLIENNNYVEPCYCDHGCLDVGDCCPDFKDYCGGKC